jgi:hypothetical protein
MSIARATLPAVIGLVASLATASSEEDARRVTQRAATADPTAIIRALRADPSLREPSGLVENAYDFNAVDGIPGFGPIDLPSGQRFAKARR